jgi:holliday junction DNA helicase RuvA
MICAIEGELIQMRDGVAQIRVPGGLVYEVHIPVYAQGRLEGEVGQAVSLCTRHYLESQSQGAVLVPRLVGFRSADERAFFELLTTVKGLGSRRAMRALAEPPAEVAAAIARRDHRALQKLPEIGKRLAETIIVDLADKAARFALVVEGEVSVKPSRVGVSSAANEAVAALVALGHTAAEAERAVDRALARGGDDSVDAIITAALSGG